MVRLGLSIIFTSALLLCEAPVARADELGRNAKRACADEAEDEGFRVRRQEVVGKDGDRARVVMRLGFEGDRFEAVCRFDEDDDRARIRNVRRADRDGGGRDRDRDDDDGIFGAIFDDDDDRRRGSRSRGGGEAEARDACMREIRRRNWDFENMTDVDRRRDLVKLQLWVRDDNDISGRWRCTYDARDGSVTFERTG